MTIDIVSAVIEDLRAHARVQTLKTSICVGPVVMSHQSPLVYFVITHNGPFIVLASRAKASIQGTHYREGDLALGWLLTRPATQQTMIGVTIHHRWSLFEPDTLEIAKRKISQLIEYLRPMKLNEND